MGNPQVTVVGGGVAGLIAAISLAKRGRNVKLLEQTRHLGGRAATTHQNGFYLNLGPHALYAGGTLCKTLRAWSIPFSAKPPALGGGAFLVEGQRKFVFPYDTPRLLLTGALGAAEKMQTARLLADIPKERGGDRSVQQWLDVTSISGRARRLIETIITLSTYTRDMAALSANAALKQLRLALGSGVLYVDGGWESLVSGLEAAAKALGVVIETGVPVEQLPAGPTVLAVPPLVVEKLTGTKFEEHVPVRLATLDLGLKKLPPKAATFGLGLDRSLYYSVHSAVASLAPQGSDMVHIGKYLAVGEDGCRKELEEFADVLMAGWREQVAVARFLPNLVVTHAVSTVKARPESNALGMKDVAIAGDWVGNDGMLADAAAESGLRAADWLNGGSAS
jgi:NAD(P)-binding Rossmann-like domain